MLIFLIVISFILIIVGIVALWGECEPGEGGACFIKWAILWLWRHKLIFTISVIIVGVGVGSWVYYRRSQKLKPFRARAVPTTTLQISPMPSDLRGIPTTYPSAFWDESTGEAKIFLFYSPIVSADVIGNAVIYYGEEEKPSIIKISNLREKPKIYYDSELGIMTIILSNKKVESKQSFGKVVGYLDADSNLVKLEIFDLSTE